MYSMMSCTWPTASSACHLRAIASSSHGGERGQPWVVPAVHVAALHQGFQLALAHDRVRDVEPRVLPHHGLVQAQHLRK